MRRIASRVEMKRSVSTPDQSTGSRSKKKLKNLNIGGNGFVTEFVGSPSALEEERILREIEDTLLVEGKRAQKAFDLTDIIPFIHDGVEDIVQDDFSRCFESETPQPWNWNAYLYPMWAVGVVIRYCILFPLRALSLLLGVLSGLIALFLVKRLCFNKKVRAAWERKIIRYMCSVFVFSWTGVIKYHGAIPARKPNQIYVANHTSMIDVIVLQQMNTFSLVGQKHPGWVGFFQDSVLGCLGCVWFNRGEDKDRMATANKIKAHVADANNNRLLVFPEGTCVNNHYCVQFKKGTFEMGAEICPIAIKYNKIFVDAFWNSRQQSFLMHLVQLMSSWAVVCEVWYLEPQSLRPNESPVDFASRVKQMIADQAGLINVEWDGYLKHFRPSARYVAERQKLFAESLKERLSEEESNNNNGAASDHAGVVDVSLSGKKS